MGQIDRLDAQRAVAVATERRARARLRDARFRMAQLRSRIAALDVSERTSERLLAAQLVAAYKGDRSDGAAYLLAAGSFSDLLSRVDVMDRVASSERQALSRISAVRAHIQADRRDQAAAVASAVAAVADASAARKSIDTLLAARRQTLASVSAQVRAGIAGEEQRRNQLATSTGSTTSAGTAVDGSVFYGDATWYGWVLAGHVTASGEIFDPNKLTCANPWLPFGTLLRVTYNGRSVVVRVNDRGPFGGGVIDLSLRAAQVIDLVSIGRARVRLQIVGSA